MTGRLALLAALVGIASISGLSASAHAKAEIPVGCDGVRLLLAPLIISGYGDVATEISGPADDTVQCVPVGASRSELGGGPRGNARYGRGGCAKAREEATNLSGRAASKAVRCLIAYERSQRGLTGLRANRKLARAARNHTSYMLANNCFSHQCAGEPDLARRVTATDYLPCTCSWTVAENLAWGRAARSTPAAIVDAWMNSPPHRDTLLNATLRDVGVAMKKGIPGSNAKGATYTADFGARL
jgi:uncharacterized protein YkwD